MGKIEGGSVTFEVPRFGADGKPKRIDKMEGKLFQRDQDATAFWKILVSKGYFRESTIRKLTTTNCGITGR